MARKTVKTTLISSSVAPLANPTKALPAKAEPDAPVAAKQVNTMSLQASNAALLAAPTYITVPLTSANNTYTQNSNGSYRHHLGTALRRDASCIEPFAACAGEDCF